MICTFHVEELQVARREVLRFLGLPKGAEEDRRVAALVDRAWSIGATLARCGAVYASGPVEISSEETTLAVALEPGKMLLESGALARHCRGAEQMSLLACTIGSGVEDEVRRLFANGEMALAAALDAFGSAAAEALAAVVDREIAGLASDSGYRTTRRYSPGYGDFGLSAQPELLSILDADRIGLSCTGSGMLVPQKSVTAAIGWLAQD